MSLRIGIIGFGRIGAEHAGWIGRMDGAEVGRVYDPTAARRVVAEGRGMVTCDGIEALLGDDSIEAVLVSTPTSMHGEHVLAGLAAGKHVMVEKPMALDLPTSERMVDAAKQAGRVLSVFQNRRWDLDYLTLKRGIESGVLGRVFNIESRLHQWGSCVGPAVREWRPGWRNEATYGGGGLYDWGSHFVDQILRMIPQKPLRVFAQLRGNVWTADCDDFARVLIDFEGGCTGMVEINTTTRHPGPRWHVDGTGGSAWSESDAGFDVGKWAEIHVAGSGQRAAGSGEEGIAETQATRGRDRVDRLTLDEEGVLDEVEIWRRFAGACRGESEPAVLVETVLPTMAVLDAARESSRRGCAIDLPNMQTPNK